MFRRRIPFYEIAFATVVGVAGGVYVYRPMFEPLQKNKASAEADHPEDVKNEPESRGQSDAKEEVNAKD